MKNYRALLSFRNRKLPFFGPSDRLPVLLALILGFQHALAMVGGLVVPPLLLSGSSGAALVKADQTYLVSAALICGSFSSSILTATSRILTSSLTGCGLGTFLQVSRIPLGRGYFLGSGVLNVIGTSASCSSSCTPAPETDSTRDLQVSRSSIRVCRT